MSREHLHLVQQEAPSPEEQAEAAIDWFLSQGFEIDPNRPDTITTAIETIRANDQDSGADTLTGAPPMVSQYLRSFELRGQRTEAQMETLPLSEMSEYLSVVTGETMVADPLYLLNVYNSELARGDDRMYDISQSMQRHFQTLQNQYDNGLLKQAA